jgi:hypothetical protein
VFDSAFVLLLLFCATTAMAANVTSLSGVTSNCINTANAGNSVVVDNFTPKRGFRRHGRLSWP